MSWTLEALCGINVQSIPHKYKRYVLAYSFIRRVSLLFVCLFMRPWLSAFHHLLCLQMSRNWMVIVKLSKEYPAITGEVAPGCSDSSEHWSQSPADTKDERVKKKLFSIKVLFIQTYERFLNHGAVSVVKRNKKIWYQTH